MGEADRSPANPPGPAPILATKLFFPRTHQDVVNRPRLTGRLDCALKGPLTLISAPAGFGKTTLAVEWQESVLGRRCGLAWLAVDRDDNDPMRFWTYFIAALRMAHPAFGDHLMPLLRSSPAPPAQMILTLAINELAALDHDLVLVLDDYHAIDSPSIHEAMAYLVDHLPPRLHLAVLTRSDPPWPYARWRARSTLTEIRAEDLRFTSEETTAFLGESMGLELSHRDMLTLEARTEGWIAGLQMAALSMRGRPDAASFIQSFTGSHRYVMDFLIEEVLSREPENVQQFLLRTALLDSLAAPLCDALTGRNDGQEMLERLEKANLFLLPLDDERRWYRYHHLFAEVLLNQLRRLQPRLVPDLHILASEWYEQAGLIDQSFHHAISAPDWNRAARLVVSNWLPVGHSGRCTTVMRWLEALPAQVVQNHAILSAAYAWMLWMTGNTRDIERHLDDASRSLDRPLPRGGIEERQLPVMPTGIAALRSHLARHKGNIGTALEYAREALALAPEDAPLVRGHGYLALAHAYRESGETDKSIEMLNQGIPASLAGGNPFAAATSTFYLARTKWLQGQLKVAARICDEALRQAEESGRALMPATGMIHLAMAGVLLEQDELEDALRHLDPTAALAKHVGFVDVSLNYGLVLARLRRAKSDLIGALAAVDAAEQAVQRAEVPLAIAQLRAYRARLYLDQGNLDKAVRWAEEAASRAGDDRGYTRQMETMTIARVRFAQGDTGAAIEQLNGLIDPARAAGTSAGVIETRLLRSLASYSRDDLQPAVADLEQALAIGESGGYLRAFLDEGSRLAEMLAFLTERGFPSSARLAAHANRIRGRLSPSETPAVRQSGDGESQEMGAPVSTGAQSPLAEPLSDRELEILRFIAQGHSNQEIAELAVISLNTVKRHTSNIFGKLGVSSRTQAILLARELGLI